MPLSAAPVELLGELLPSSDGPNSVKWFSAARGCMLSFTCCRNAALEPILMVFWVPLSGERSDRDELWAICGVWGFFLSSGCFYM